MHNLAFREHDHGRCVREALSVAERICRERGLRFTPLRRRVLELVWGSHGPIGAYEVLDRLRAERRRAAPPTVYRALQFLSGERLIHRIESLNAYVGCVNPGERHNAQHLICGLCGAVAEVEVADVSEAIRRRAAEIAFEVRRQTVEVMGLCARCGGERRGGRSWGVSRTFR